MELEEAIKILLELKKGNEELIDTESKIFHTNEDEDIQHYKDEIEAIERVLNNYLKEKARADVMEKDYSKALTKIDQLKADLYETNNIISDYIDVTAKQDKMIEYMVNWINDHEDPFEGCHENEKCGDDYISCEQCIKQYFEKKAEESE